VVLASGAGDPRQLTEQFQAAIAQHRHWERAPLSA
jgi:hypothetical protein